MGGGGPEWRREPWRAGPLLDPCQARVALFKIN